MMSEYWKRIGLENMPPATESGLRALQLAQRLSIPFENLDVRLGREIKLDHKTIFEKLVTRGRGGYCFEQNLLLANALETIGIPYRPALARVWIGASSTPPLTHLVLLAQQGKGIWLMDAGFGGGYCPPLLLANGSEVQAPDGSTYRLSSDPQLGWLLERDSGGQLARQFSFTESPAHYADILLSNHWTSTHPTSRFKQHTVVNQISRFGRRSLMNNLMTNSAAPDEAVTITTTNQLADILLTEFGINLSVDEVRILAIQMGMDH